MLNGCGGGGSSSPNSPTPAIAPAITTVVAGSITTTGAIITWTTDQAADSQVEYGTTSSYGSSTWLNSPTTSHAVALSGLVSGTTYHFRVKSGSNNGTSVSGDFSFATSSPAPTISNVAAGSVTTNSATITWSTDQPANSQVEYGTSVLYGSSTTLDNTAVTTHNIVLAGLTRGTTYHFRVKSGNTNGNSVSADLTLNTAAYSEVKAEPRTIAMIVHDDVITADARGLVAQLAQAITADYAAKADSNDPVVTTTIIKSPADAAGVYGALRGVKDLWGIMLIGNVHAPQANFPQGRIIFDMPYRVPNCTAYAVASDGTASYPDSGWTPILACEKKAWLSRIYGTTDQVLSFIQKDLNTRHGDPILQQYGYVRAGWFGGMPDPDMSTYWVNNGLYPSVDDITYVTTDGTLTYTAASRLQAIKQSLATGTEFVSIFAHGSANSILIQGSGEAGSDYAEDSLSLTSGDILALPNHARVINMISCSTGDFSAPDYFAGAALFGGDTLLVAASTTWLYASTTDEASQVETKYHLLADGATFADIDFVRSGVTDLFGDPTISLRPQRQGNLPILTFSTDGVNFSRFHGPVADLDLPFTQPSVGGAKVQQTVVLGNHSTTNLAVQITTGAEFAGVNGELPCSGSCGFGGGITLVSPNVSTGTCETNVCHIVLTIAPGATLPITFGLEPIFVSQAGATTNRYGTTTGRFQIHTVDPHDSRQGISDPKVGLVNLYLSGDVRP